MKLATLALLFPVLLHASSHERAEQFFLCHYEAAQQLYYCHGIPTELSLSVWALESKYGSSCAAAQCNNLGGIKSYEGGKKHNKHFVTLDDFYQAFAAIFQQPCYKDMQPQTTGEYLEAMEWACCSYHRSKEYSRKINWIIKRYKLKGMSYTTKSLIEEIRTHYPNTFNTLKPLSKHIRSITSTTGATKSNTSKIEVIALVTKLLGCKVEFCDFIQDFKSGDQAIFKGWQVFHENNKAIFIQNQEEEVLMFTKDLQGDITFCSKIAFGSTRLCYVLSSLVSTIELELK